MTTLLIATALIAAGIAFAARGVDVRLILSLAAFTLFVLAGQPAKFFVVFASEMANEKTVVPICAAMGFAFVMTLTACDKHLVHLLVRPLRFARPLLVPGGVAAAYLVNMAIVSQSSTAATVGPVLIPLAVAAGVPVSVAGAMLLLGSSMGGELFNPGAVEIVTLGQLTNLQPIGVVARVIPANVLACGVALLAFWWLSAREKPSADPAQPEPVGEREADFQLNVGQALVPLLPLAILFTVNGLVLTGRLTLPQELTTSVQILAAMLVGLLAAAAAAPAKVREILASFFEGAGYAYTHVISLIVTATAFTEAVKANGLIELLTGALASRPVLAVVASISIPGTLAMLAGTGIAPAVAVMKVLVPVASQIGLDPVRLGSYSAVAGQLGRTMSPAAAVVMMSAAVSGRPPLELVRRVALPLVLGMVALMIAAALGVV